MSSKRRTKRPGKGRQSPGPRVKLPHAPLKFEFLIAVLVMVVAICVLYPELVFQDAVFFAGDNQAAAGFSAVGKAALDEGIYPVWNPYVFSGMPSFASLQYTPFVYPVTPVIGLLHRYLFFPQYTWMLFHTLLIGVGVYLLLRGRGVHYLASIPAGVLMMWVPNLVAVGSHGHGTQACASGYIPIALLLWDRLWRGRGTLTYGAGLVIVLGLSMLRAHLQISYYTYALVVLYIIFYGVARLRDGRRGEMPGATVLPGRWFDRLTAGRTRYTLKVAGVEVGYAALVFAIIVGGSLLVSAVLYLPVHDYAQYSIRGAAEGGGVDYQYATSWSLHPAEALTFLFPYAFGFGNTLYFGHMPFTDYPNYLGVAVLAFAVASLFFVRGRGTMPRFVKFLAFVVVVATFTAFGKFFPVLYDPLYKLAPYFNKFRVPVMVLIVQQVAVILMFGVGFDAMLRLDPDRGRRIALRALMVSGALLVLAVATMGYWTGPFTDAIRGDLVMARSPSQQAALAREAGGLLAGDLVRFGVMCVVLTGLMLAYYARRLAAVAVAAGVLVLACVDYYVVDRNILHPEEFRDNEQLRIIRDGSVLDRFVQPGGVARYLEQDEREFRVFPMASPRQPFSGPFRSNQYMAFGISSIGGYQPAKLAVYEDFLSRMLPASLSRGDYSLVDMLNVRYIISGAQFPEHPRFQPRWQGADAQGQQRFVYENMGALPRVYPVDRYRVAGDDETISLLGSGAVDVAEEVVLTRDPPVVPVSDAGAQASVTDWGFNEIRMEATLPQPCILVVSEVYYPDWKATVNGREVEVLQANHILRALALPAGEHEIVMSYDTSILKRGLTLSVSAFSLSLLTLVGSLIVTRTRSRRRSGSADLHSDV